MRAFKRLFVANRGEVAARIRRSCEGLDIDPVFGVSEADRDAPWIGPHQSVCLGPARSRDSYLDAKRIVQAARQSGCTALHPGWGFLSENPLLPALCEQHGISFVGPRASVMALMGSKTPAKQAMAKAGLRLIPGSDGILRDLDHARAVAAEIGFPVLLKAESGGGGRGMRIARAEDELQQAFEEATAEARAAFGDPRVYMERLIEGGRHVEIQLLADRYGDVVHLGERDCTVQRNHQKLIEESPAPILDADERARTLEAARRATAAIGYTGAGTMEFLLDADGKLRFMEMNTRLQVEHCVSEMRTGVDLVAQQLWVAAGGALADREDLPRDDAGGVLLEGASIECRINAEDPSQVFRPAPGVLSAWELPELDPKRLRVDTHVEAGYRVPPHYDSLLCKVIAWGETRDRAIESLIGGLEGLKCEGVPTTIPMHLEILRSRAFAEHDYDTRKIPGWEQPKPS